MGISENHQQSAGKKSMALRAAWIVPNVLCYFLLIYIGVFVGKNAEHLEEINQLVIWLFMLVVMFMVSVFGTFRIVYWIKKGKL
ncbi:hypothetical protein [Brevibacillus nitrificans]|uniref:hypothetical protein n=1 Tax=Brevibacillus nitrificans TaxID=651560 RepID=UPI0028593FA8|nr:hypothetical protein [Brevibacillus nitrificans]MDR7319347.1 membrane protein DedA with SNARE-associated domain [Brevibacillus nitrificans]